MCTSGVTTVTPPVVDNSSVESPVKSESRNWLFLLYTIWTNSGVFKASLNGSEGGGWSNRSK